MTKDKERKEDGTRPERPVAAQEEGNVTRVVSGNVPTVGTVDSSRIQMPTALEIKPKDLEGKFPPEPPRERYWLGTLPDSPHYNVAIAGIMFQRTSEINVVKGDPPRTVTTEALGQVLELTQDKIDQILSRVQNEVVRFRGKRLDDEGGRRGLILNINNKNFRRAEGDLPLGMYVYIVKLNEQMPDGYRINYPEPLIRRK
jgi:hypothetical protein